MRNNSWKNERKGNSGFSNEKICSIMQGPYGHTWNFHTFKGAVTFYGLGCCSSHTLKVDPLETRKLLFISPLRYFCTDFCLHLAQMDCTQIPTFRTGLHYNFSPQYPALVHTLPLFAPLSSKLHK